MMTCLLHHGDRARRHGNYRSHSVSVLCAKLDYLLQNINWSWIQSVCRWGWDNTYETEWRQLHISLNVQQLHIQVLIQTVLCVKAKVLQHWNSSLCSLHILCLSNLKILCVWFFCRFHYLNKSVVYITVMQSLLNFKKWPKMKTCCWIIPIMLDQKTHWTSCEFGTVCAS